VTSPLEEQVQASLAELRNYQAEMASVQHTLMERTVRTTSQDRLITVTVGGQGEIQKVEFNNTGYRSLTPSELGRALVAVIAEARAQMAEEVIEVMTPFLGRGQVLRDGMIGGTPLDELFAPLREAAKNPTPRR
jgi:DNA-binding protein YbaB